MKRGGGKPPPPHGRRTKEGMREIRIKVSDDEYRKLTEIAKKDAEEYGITTREAFRKNLDYMVYCFLENNCHYWDIE